MKKLYGLVGGGALAALLGTLAMKSGHFAHGPGCGPWHGSFGGRGAHPPFGHICGDFEEVKGYKDQVHSALAEALGLTVEELEAKLADKTLEDVAKEQNVMSDADLAKALDPMRMTTPG